MTYPLVEAQSELTALPQDEKGAIEHLWQSARGFDPTAEIRAYVDDLNHTELVGVDLFVEAAFRARLAAELFEAGYTITKHSEEAVQVLISAGGCGGAPSLDSAYWAGDLDVLLDTRKCGLCGELVGDKDAGHLELKRPVHAAYEHLDFVPPRPAEEET